MDRASKSVESALVARSAGMVAAQAVCDLDEAILRMQEHGVRTRRTLEEVATAVVERRIRFGPQAPG